MDMDIYELYSYTSSAWLVIQGIPLAFYPRWVLSLVEVASPEDGTGVPPPTNFTLYSLHTLGAVFLAISVTSFFISIRAPPSQLPSPNEGRTPLTTATATAPPSLSHSVLPLSTFLHAATAAWAYRQYMLSNSTSWFIELIAAVIVAGMGGSAMLFGDEKRAGKGSRWPFESKKARVARKQKWADRKEEVKKAL